MNPYQQPYFGRPAFNYNPYQQMQQPMVQQQTIQQPIQPMQPVGLQGKSVDSIDVVKAMDIPLDGSVSYFPLVDGTAIITKQLQSDGTSKTIIYQPIVDNERKIEAPKFVTFEDLERKMKSLDNTDEIEKLKEQIQDLSDELDNILKEIKENKQNYRKK